MATWASAIATLFTAKGDVLGTSDGDAVGRLAVGTNGQVLTADSTQTLGFKWATPSGGSSVVAGQVLDLKEATASAAYATTTATQADVDATNLVVTFTVPASGVVLIEVEGLSESVSGAGHVLSIREGSTTLQTAMVGGTAYYGHTRVTFRVTGLTPGASKTYKLGHARLTGSGTATLYTGGNAGTSGNAIIRAVAA